jgi:hypothetical protein
MDGFVPELIVDDLLAMDPATDGIGPTAAIPN